MQAFLILSSITFYLISHHVDRIYGPLARYVKLRVALKPGMPGMFSPPPQVSDPDMHYRMYRVSWCMQGCVVCRDAYRDRQLAVCFEVGGGETVPAFPEHAQPAILHFWEEAHDGTPRLGSHGEEAGVKFWQGAFITNDTHCSIPFSWNSLTINSLVC